MIPNRITYSKNIKEDSLFEVFKNNNLNNYIDKCYPYMYDSQLKKNVKTENNKEYFLTTSELFWSDVDKESKEIIYKLNNFGHRSDDFKKLSNDNFNILFAGCSTTFGQGLPIEDSWSNILYKDISTKHNVGPYNCLSFPGASSFKIILNVIKYINTFGSPNAIFILLPDYIRQEKYNYLPDRLSNITGETSKSMYVKVMASVEEREAEGIIDEEGFYYLHSLLLILSAICNINNISLYVASWDTITNKRMLELGIPGCVDIRYEKSNQFYEYYIESNSDIIDKKYLFDARDKMHPGYLVHLYTAKRFLNIMEGNHD